MNFKEALIILDISLNDFDIDETNTILLDKAKHQYHKLALLFHPDKNRDEPAAIDNFRKINEAYEYIKCYDFTDNVKSENDFMNESSSDDEGEPSFKIRDFSPEKYKVYIKHFLSTIYKEIPKKQKHVLVDLLSNLTFSCEQNVILILEKYKSNQILLFNIYNLIIKYKDIFKLSFEVLDKIEKFIKPLLGEQLTSMKENNSVINLKSQFRDLIEGNVFYSKKYNVYVPLWALNMELCYDITDIGEIIFNCSFDIKDISKSSMSDEIQSISLNEEHRELYMNVVLKIKDIFDKENILLEIDGIKIKLETEKIRIKKKQIITLFNCGLLLYDINDIFNTNNRGNIIIELELIL